MYGTRSGWWAILIATVWALGGAAVAFFGVLMSMFLADSVTNPPVLWVICVLGLCPLLTVFGGVPVALMFRRGAGFGRIALVALGMVALTALAWLTLPVATIGL